MEALVVRWALRAILAVALCGGGAVAHAADAELVLDSKIPLGQVIGRIDHLAIDLPRKRLFVAELGNNSVAVIDLAQGALFKRLSGLREPQGIGYATKPDLIYVANAGDGTVDIFKADDLTPTGKVNLGSDADNVRADGPDRMIVGYGNGALAFLDAASGKKLAEIALPAHPESFRMSPTGDRIYVNLPEANQIAVVDRASAKVVAHWGLPGLSTNFPMALDSAGNRLFVGYRSTPTIAAFDTSTGGLLGQSKICGDEDDLFYDSARNRVYVSCGAGYVAVLDASGGLREIARLATQPGARTALFVPALGRLFVAARAQGQNPAAIWVFRVQ